MKFRHCVLCLGRGGQIATDARGEVEVAPLFNWLEHNPRTQRAQVVHYVVHSLWVTKYLSIFMKICSISSWTFSLFFMNILAIFSWKISPYFHEHIFRISFSLASLSPVITQLAKTSCCSDQNIKLRNLKLSQIVNRFENFTYHRTNQFTKKWNLLWASYSS